MADIFVVVGGKWRDQVNGYTYHNSKILDIRNNTFFYSGFVYGYGSAYIDTAASIIKERTSNDFIVIDMGSFYVPKRKLEKCDF